MKLVVFSICKDEEATIGQVLDGIPKKIPGISSIETLVVSDGSTDRTVEVARAHGADKIIAGQSQKRLAYRFQEAVEKVLMMGADVAVNIDGDLQFSSGDIPKLLEPILKSGKDFVAADRFTGPSGGKKRRPEGMPTGKYWANRLGSWIVGNLSGDTFHDVTCGFRAYTKKALLSININSNYTYTQESFQVLAIKKMDIASVPIDVKYYPGRQSRVVKSFWQFLFGSAINILRAFRDYAPLKFFGSLGAVLFVPGVIMGGFVGIYWASTGLISPYKAFGLIGLYLVSLGVIIWIVGLMADMFDRMLSNQEKILEELKKQRFNKD